MKNKTQENYLNQPRVKQFLRDNYTSSHIRRIILSPDISVTIKDFLIDNSFHENIINDFIAGHIR